MKKNLFLLLIWFLIGCSSTNPTTLNNKLNIHNKMTKDEVISILGTPRKRQLEGELEKWVYYQPAISGSTDNYFIVYFYKELVGETWESIDGSSR